MTLAIGVVVGDGVALVADSRTTQGPVVEGAPWRVASDATHKVFQVGEVAVATYGYAFLLSRNIAGHMAEFATQVEDGANASSVAEGLRDFFLQRFKSHVAQYPNEQPGPGTTALGFLVGGFDAGVGCIHEVSLPDGAVTKVGDSTKGTAAWRGQTDVVVRLVKGVDFDQLGRHAEAQGLLDHAKALGQSFLRWIQDSVRHFQSSGRRRLRCLSYPDDDRCPTPDPWNYRFPWFMARGRGPIEVATVTSQAGFRWLQRTELQVERPDGLAAR